MKTILVTIAAAIISLNAAAHNMGEDPNSYCVESRDGKRVVTYNGNELNRTTKLTDGARLKPNGTIVFTGGKRVKLNEGECFNENNLVLLESRESKMEMKKQERKERREARRNKREVSRNDWE
jgi:hypothetical protein